MSSKRILFVCPSYPATGGVEAVTAELALAFLERSYEVFLMVSAIRMTASRMDDLVDRMYVLDADKPLKSIARCIKEQDIRIVLNQGDFSDVCLLKSAFPQVLFITSLHAIPFWEVETFRNTSLLQHIRNNRGLDRIKVVARFVLSRMMPNGSHLRIRAWYRRRIEQSDAYVVLDPLYKEQLESALYDGQAQSAIRVIGNPLKYAACSDLEGKANRVLYVGRMNLPQKQVGHLLEIWAKVQEEMPDWELDLVGDGPDVSLIRKKAFDLGLSRVHFYGMLDPEPFYQRSSILCLTSLLEGMPLVIKEAQAFGVVPIVYEFAPSVHHLVEQDRDGRVVPLNDIQTFVRVLIATMRDTEKRMQMATEAVRSVQAHSTPVVLEKWIRLFEDVAGDSPESSTA